jgi:tungstate transport system substrate-binding protein
MLFSVRNKLPQCLPVVFSLVLLLALVFSIAGCSSSTTTTPPASTPVASTPAATSPTVTTPTTTQPPASTSLPPSSTTPAASMSPSPSVTAVPKPPIPQLLMASTTSTRDTGLLDVLLPIFQKQTGYEVKPNFVGSGAAIALGQQGNADVLFVHSPDAELAFMQLGYGVDRRLVMHNYFIVLGPASDPAKIFGMNDAAAAFKKIAAAKAPFYSRGDNSGTDVAEKAIWAKIGIPVKDGSSSNPSWYIEGGGGMLSLLQIASEKNGYVFSDMSTYLFNKSKLSLGLAVDGDPALINVYHVISVNSQKYNNINILGARAFSDFITSKEIQDFISTYGISQFGQALFIADYGKTEASLGTK